MSEIIVQRRPKININPNRLSNVSYDSTDLFYVRKPSLPPRQFKDANQQKVLWLNAVSIECRLRGNEKHVLEALTFFTDPVYGHGEPSIGALKERLEQKGIFIHYDTVRQSLIRLQQKGAISIQFRGMKLTNHYRLIGFEYKSEDCYRETQNNNNSPSLLKRERGGSKSKNISKAPLAAVCSYALPEEEPRPSSNFVKNVMDEIRKANSGRLPS